MSEIGHLEISQAFIVSLLVKCQHETDGNAKSPRCSKQITNRNLSLKTKTDKNRKRRSYSETMNNNVLKCNSKWIYIVDLCLIFYQVFDESGHFLLYATMLGVKGKVMVIISR